MGRIALVERLSAADKIEALAGEIAASPSLACVRPTAEGWAGHDYMRGLQRVHEVSGQGQQPETPPRRPVMMH